MAFIDVYDLAAYLRLPAEELGWLGEFAVRAAEEAVKGVLDRDVSLVTDDEIALDGTGTATLLLPEPPVVDVTRVTEDGVELVVDTDYVLGWHGILYRVSPAVWAKGVRNITVTYTHGWSEIGGDEGNAVPMDIREAALEFAKGVYEAGQAPAEGITSERTPLYSYTVETAAASAASERLPALRAKLARYIVPRVG